MRVVLVSTFIFFSIFARSQETPSSTAQVSESTGAESSHRHLDPQQSKQDPESPVPQEAQPQNADHPKAEPTPDVIRESLEADVLLLVKKNNTLEKKIATQQTQFTAAWDQKLKVYREFNKELTASSEKL